MDETHTIFACGAGAVSKIKDPYSNQLERIFNFKYPHEYESRFSEMLERKEKAKHIFLRYLKNSQSLWPLLWDLFGAFVQVFYTGC